MIKAEELVYAYLQHYGDFEKELILTNYYHSDWEADILTVADNGLSHEIEIKLSKSDFKNDFKKFYTNQKTGDQFLKHDKIRSGDYICNQFSFLLPMGMVDLDSIPAHCGVIEFYHDEDHWETSFYPVREAPMIHAEPYWQFCDKDQVFRSLAKNLLMKKMQLKGQQEELIFRKPTDYKK